MADAKDRAWDAQVTRQVTAGPRPWWQRLVMPVVAPRIAPPLPDGVTPELLARYRTEQARLAAMPTRSLALLPLDIFVTSALAWDAPAPELDPRAVVTEDTAPQVRPAQSARHADRAADAPEPTLLLCARGLPMPAHPQIADLTWVVQSRLGIREEWAAREDRLDDVLLAAMLGDQQFHMRVTMLVPAAFVWQRQTENDVLALGRKLAGYACQEMHLSRAEVLIEASMTLATVRQPTWDVVVWLDDAPESECAA